MKSLDLTALVGMTEALTAEDIAEGIMDNCALCPVGRAVGRMFRRLFNTDENSSCFVANKTVFVQVGGVNEVIAISERLSAWIYAFDHEQEVKPITLCVYTWNSRGFDYMLDMTDEDAQAMQAA